MLLANNVNATNDKNLISKKNLEKSFLDNISFYGAGEKVDDTSYNGM
ncbi:hypothetical protein [Halarcobacter sp.]|nr:hypothetical protein [Halarcobacter sp.]